MALLTAWTLLLAASARGQQESGWLERPTTLCYDGASAWAWDPEVVPPGTEQGWKLIWETADGETSDPITVAESRYTRARAPLDGGPGGALRLRVVGANSTTSAFVPVVAGTCFSASLTTDSNLTDPTNATNSTVTSHTDGVVSQGRIAGIVVGSVLGALITIGFLVALFLHLQRGRRKREGSVVYDNSMWGSTPGTLSPATGKGSISTPPSTPSTVSPLTPPAGPPLPPVVVTSSKIWSSREHDLVRDAERSPPLLSPVSSPLLSPLSASPPQSPLLLSPMSPPLLTPLSASPPQSPPLLSSTSTWSSTYDDHEFPSPLPPPVPPPPHRLPLPPPDHRFLTVNSYGSSPTHPSALPLTPVNLLNTAPLRLHRASRPLGHRRRPLSSYLRSEASGETFGVRAVCSAESPV